MVEFITEKGTHYKWEDTRDGGGYLTSGRTGDRLRINSVYQPIVLGYCFVCVDAFGLIRRTSPVKQILPTGVLKLVKTTASFRLTDLVNNDRETLMRLFAQTLGGAENIRFNPVGIDGENIIIEITGIKEV